MVTGGAAIATNPLAAFAASCRRIFASTTSSWAGAIARNSSAPEFVLPQTNSLFDAPRWTQGQRGDYLKDGYLPIIPLIGALKTEIPQARRGRRAAFQPESIRDAIEARLSKLADVAMKSSLGDLAGPAAWGDRPRDLRCHDKAIEAIKSALGAKGVDLL